MNSSCAPSTGSPTLVSSPVAALADLEGKAQTVHDVAVPADRDQRQVPEPAADAYRLRVEVAPDPRDPGRRRCGSA